MRSKLQKTRTKLSRGTSASSSLLFFSPYFSSCCEHLALEAAFTHVNDIYLFKTKNNNYKLHKIIIATPILLVKKAISLLSLVVIKLFNKICLLTVEGVSVAP